MKQYYKQIKSPVGKITLISDEHSLVSILWENEKIKESSTLICNPNHAVLKKTEKQLQEYFSGKRTHFDIPFKFNGTSFQKKVWKTLSEIPYGETKSYLDIAKKIKSPKACRAVGGAIGKNPISIINPCHRVIGSNGSLTGFGGGLKKKKLLLTLEGVK